MRARLAAIAVAAIVAALLPTTSNVAAQPIPGTTCNLFPANNILNTDISSLAVASQSAMWKNNMAQNAKLHPDLGTVAQQYGMPLNVAPPPTTGLTPTFGYYSQSDHPAEGYPIDQSTLIQGGPSAPSGSDRHALVVNKNSCKLYELYNLQNFTTGQQPSAGSGAVWDLTSNAMRTDGFTSADAAGLPIFPAIVRFDDVARGIVRHAMRVTVRRTRRAYVYPARHFASRDTNASLPRMGDRLRLRRDFDVSIFPAHAQAVLRGLQQYGMFVADNGANWLLSIAPDRRIQGLDSLARVKGSDFEVVVPTGPDEGPRRHPVR